MNKPWFIPRHIRNLLLAGVVIYLLWYFFEMVVLVAIAMLVAIAGSPLVKLLNKISIGKYKMPEGLSVSFTLLIFLGLFVGLFYILVPLFLEQSRSLISRYVLGIIMDTLAVMTSYALILSILGVKGAIVIAVLAGFLNVIPYIGPVIGVMSGIVIGLTASISSGVLDGLDVIAIKIGLGMLGVIILDNIFYDPFIQGKSIQAHPLEIFLVIIAGEIIGGVIAMIVIIPVYGVLEILVTRYLHHFPQIQMIENLIEKN